ncbi:MAG: Rieske 2Fe-2S domain-containing protein, partial [Actinomycetales bacterium]
MLTVEQNEELTQVGPGKPMGELLRRYWYPIAFEQDFDQVATKSVRLLGENWTLFKTPKGGRYGIVAEACPHRRASLTYGVVHEDGIRCGYHGWKWDFDGKCMEQPAEADNQNFRDRVQQNAGKAEAMGGMIWVYVGPSPAPELPRFDVFVMDGVKDCGYTTLPCNWLQIMENAVDPHHVEWLH